MKAKEVIFQKPQKLLASWAGSSPQTKAGTAVTYPAIECSECSEKAASVELLGEQFL